MNQPTKLALAAAVALGLLALYFQYGRFTATDGTACGSLASPRSFAAEPGVEAIIADGDCELAADERSQYRTLALAGAGVAVAAGLIVGRNGVGSAAGGRSAPEPGVPPADA